MFGVYLYICAIYVFSLVVVIISTQTYISAFDALTVFALPFYQGVVMRIVRMFAFANEIFFSSSRNDDYVPARIRRALYIGAR